MSIAGVAVKNGSAADAGAAARTANTATGIRAVRRTERARMHDLLSGEFLSPWYRAAGSSNALVAGHGGQVVRVPFGPVPDERRFLEMDDGVRIAVNLHFPDAAAVARRLRGPSVPQGRLLRRHLDLPAVLRRREPRRLPRRRPRLGSSEGVAEDEYTDRELRDHVDDRWLAAQEWSNGNVGMYGTSYSGFNSLQVAALRPPALKAIVPIYATDRRYTDDVHYGGGARRGIDFLDYPAYMVALNVAARPVGVRRGMAGGVASPDRRERAVGPALARTPDGGRVLAARVRVLRVRRDRGRHARDRRPRGRLPEHGVPRVRALHGPKAILFGPWSHMSPRLSIPGRGSTTCP